MNIQSHANGQIAELISEEFIISDPDQALQLLGEVYYQGYESLVLHQKNLAPQFFDLKTKLAGEILQKFSNYRLRLAIVGAFEEVENGSLRNFISESNRGKLINFASSLSQALQMLK